MSRRLDRYVSHYLKNTPPLKRNGIIVNRESLASICVWTVRMDR